ncbi:MAG TPA: nitroreductase family deazaflavin-dependent oxidoreductase [Candidatus Limnocylindrales bacterium]
MEHRYRVGRAERIGNLVVKLLARAGVGPKRMYLITVVGRKTGRPYTTPVTVVETDGQRWLVAPYSGVAWAKNARASGTAKLRRGRVTEQINVEPVDGYESAPVLRAYVQIEPITRRAFGLGPDATLEEFEAVAPNHPVFRVRLAESGGSGVAG